MKRKDRIELKICVARKSPESAAAAGCLPGQIEMKQPMKKSNGPTLKPMAKRQPVGAQTLLQSRPSVPAGDALKRAVEPLVELRRIVDEIDREARRKRPGGAHIVTAFHLAMSAGLSRRALDELEYTVNVLAGKVATAITDPQWSGLLLSEPPAGTGAGSADRAPTHDRTKDDR